MYFGRLGMVISLASAAMFASHSRIMANRSDFDITMLSRLTPKAEGKLSGNSPKSKVRHSKYRQKGKREASLRLRSKKRKAKK
jgi:hypothetical protein